MIAVLGTSIDEINDLMKINLKENEVCEIANDNAIGQVIISGNKKSVSLFQKCFKRKKY